MIDCQQASQALADINETVRRVRQSRIYDLASQMMIMWGVLVFVGYLVTYLMPSRAFVGWALVEAIGITGWAALSSINRPRSGVRSFGLKFFIAFALFAAFGIFCCVLGQFGPRQISAFWPIYFMMVYTIAGLWVGYAFVAIGLGITALTLIGFFFLGNAFDLWMAFVDGGGLLLGGLWMRRS